jgi:mono/diheme cytochrome c family protein
MVLKRAFFVVFAVSSCTSGNLKKNTNSTQKKTAVSGQELFVNQCSSCHGTDGKLGASGAKDLTKSVLTTSEIIKRIKYGRNAMPPMKEALENEANIRAVGNYVYKMRN